MHSRLNRWHLVDSSEFKNRKSAINRADVRQSKTAINIQTLFEKLEPIFDEERVAVLATFIIIRRSGDRPIILMLELKSADESGRKLINLRRSLPIDVDGITFELRICSTSIAEIEEVVANRLIRID